MTVGIDIRILDSGEEGGIAQYALNLLPELFKLDRSIKFKLFSNSFKEKTNSYDWTAEKNIELFKFNIPNHFLFASAKLFNRPFIDKMIGGADVFFSPHFFLAPLSRNCKSVITLHDLSFVRYPEFFSWRKNIWHRFEMNPQKQARKADRVIAVSQSTRNDLVSVFGVDPDKIKIIYSGVSGKFFNKPEKKQSEAVKIKYGLSEKFFLFLGTVEPRKNVIGILKAFTYLVSNDLIPNDIGLVIAGKLGWLCKEVKRFYDNTPYKRLIKLIGHIDEEDKSSLYSLAKVFVYPSFFEGFGFPILEAMAAKVPVITSKNSSLPEIVGNSGILVNPYSIGEIAQAMKTLISNSFLEQTLVEEGLKRVNFFSWQKTAEKTLESLIF